MRLKIMALPRFSEIIALRYRFLNGDKMSNEERKRAKKLLNDEQLESIKIHQREVATNKINDTINMFRNAMIRNSEKGGKHV